MSPQLTEQVFIYTTKKRINVTVSDSVDTVLTKLAKRDAVPKATKAFYLLKKAIEIDEDIVLNELSEERDTKKSKFVSHEDAWS